MPKTPNYMNHILFNALSNDKIDTNEIEWWISEQYERQMVNPYQWHLIPDSWFVRLKTFLTDKDEARIRGVCKFNNYICDVASDFIGHLDYEYRRWLALPYNMDCKKDQILQRISKTNLCKLIVFDVRVLSNNQIIDLITNFSAQTQTVTRKKTKHLLSELTFNRDFFVLIGELLNKNTYLDVLSVNKLWLQMFGSARVLSRIKWNINLVLNNSRFKKWNPSCSSWYLFSAANYFMYYVSLKIRYKYHPSHISKFVGHGLRMYEGNTVALNYLQCDLSNLQWISVLNSNRYRISLDRAWYGMEYFFNYKTDYCLKFIYISNLTYKDFDLFIRADVVFLHKGTIDYFDTYQCLYSGKYSLCVLWELKIDNCIVEWHKAPTPQSKQCDLLLYQCKHVIRLSNIKYLHLLVQNITFIARYRYLTSSDVNFLCEMILCDPPQHKLNRFAIILWDSNCFNVTNVRGFGTHDNTGDKILSMLRVNLQAIKKSSWCDIRCGLSFHDLSYTFEKEYVINVSQLTTKFDIEQAGIKWEKLQNSDKKTDFETFPVSEMWSEVAKLWLNKVLVWHPIS